MSEQTLAYVDNNSVIHRADALSKLLWVLVVVLAGVLGAILYAVMARPALGRVQPS